MREVLFIGLLGGLNTWPLPENFNPMKDKPGQLNLNFGFCLSIYVEELCDGDLCSGYAGFEQNDPVLSWKSCNTTVQNQLVETFPKSWNLSFKSNHKCMPNTNLNSRKEPPVCNRKRKKTTTTTTTTTIRTTTSIATISTIAPGSMTEFDQMKHAKHYQGMENKRCE